VEGNWRDGRGPVPPIKPRQHVERLRRKFLDFGSVLEYPSGVQTFALGGLWPSRSGGRNGAVRLCLIFLFVLGFGSARAEGPFTFTRSGDMSSPRSAHNSVLLNDGTVLTMGGVGNQRSAELYNPATGTWAATGSMNLGRSGAVAVLLPDGRVLVAGGQITTTEVYYPATKIWVKTGSMMSQARGEPTATLLKNGKVLVCGGSDPAGNALASAEVFDPQSNGWSNTGSLATPRARHTAVLLPDGRVLVTAGIDANNQLVATSEIYDPAMGTWSPAAGLNTRRARPTATLLANGKVLVAGGDDLSGVTLTSAELFDPATGLWLPTGNLTTARSLHSGTLLPNGKVLVAGGEGNHTLATTLNSAELYDPATGQWTPTSNLNIVRASHTATLLPNGKVLMAGGTGGNSSFVSTEVYDPALGTWTNAGSTPSSFRRGTATILPDGRVLSVNLAGAQIFDPATGTWSPTANLATPRVLHTATLLPNGKVLVAGGFVSASFNQEATDTAELFDPATGTWSAAGKLATARYSHTATLLPTGKVVVIGGITNHGYFLNTCESYSPATGTWSSAGTIATPRAQHTATLLPSGRILVAHGTFAKNIELYDPASGSAKILFTFDYGLWGHTATLLPNGRVLIAGGLRDFTQTPSTQLYDPATGTLLAGNNMTAARDLHTATLLPNGKVLVAGGTNNSSGVVATAELYNPDTIGGIGTWSATASSGATHREHNATLLLNGKVLVSGGYDPNGNPVASELYDIGLGFSGAWQPQLTSVPAAVKATASVTVNGTRFRGVSEASSGNSSASATDHPVVQLRSIDNEQQIYLPVDLAAGWSDTSFTSLPLNYSAPSGPVFATVFTNGIPSDAKYMLVQPRSAQSLNISTRLRVQKGPYRILVGGFIITGSEPKRIIARALGPSLQINGVPVAGRLENPWLNLVYQDLHTSITNDNWKIDDQTQQSQQAEIEATKLAPKWDQEAAIVRTLSPGAYTVAMSGVNDTEGIGIVEIYDLDPSAHSELANVSTRGFVESGDNVMIGGLILGQGDNPSSVLIRAIGPSLPGFSDDLQDPTLELHDGNGTVLASNDNWKINDQTQMSQENEIRATTIPPPDDRESAILVELGGGNYTAILAGKNGGTGMALVEVYNLH
jgi:uncharacterized delta-60 repeat protein